MKINVDAIRAGDQFPGRGGWTALADAELLDNGQVLLGVRYADGGTAARVWEHREIEIDIERRHPDACERCGRVWTPDVPDAGQWGVLHDPHDIRVTTWVCPECGDAAEARP